MNILSKRFESKGRPEGNNPNSVSINKSFGWLDSFWDIEEKTQLENKE